MELELSDQLELPIGAKKSVRKKKLCGADMLTAYVTEHPVSHHVNARYSWHPLTSHIPWSEVCHTRRIDNSKEEFILNLVTDIAKHGLYDPITLFEGEILDGRSRYIACCIANFPAVFRTYEGDDPWSYMFTKNRGRFEMDQAAAIWVRYESQDEKVDRLLDRINEDAVLALHPDLRAVCAATRRQIYSQMFHDQLDAEPDVHA